MHKKKIKVAMLTTTFFPQVGGAEYQIKWLTEELAKNGNEVYLFTPYDASQFIHSEYKTSISNIALRNEKLNVFLDAIRMLYIFIINILKFRPDIVHAHFAFSSGFLAVVTKPIHRAPVIITSHGEDIQLVESINYGLRTNKIKAFFINIALKYCDKHVLVSNSMMHDALCSGSSEDKIEVIYNIFKEPTRNVTEDDINHAMKKHGIDSKSKIILSVSRLHSQKGLDYLLESMVFVLKNYPNTLLLIAGEGPEKERLEQLCKKYGISNNIKFLGYVSDEDKLILTKICDIFCLPSIEEAFGIGLFEPMYFSKSIVATNVGGIPEVLGTNEMLVPAKDPTSLSNSIMYLLSQNNFSPHYPFNQLRHFYPKIIVSKYEELYCSLIGRGK